MRYHAFRSASRKPNQWMILADLKIAETTA